MTLTPIRDTDTTGSPVGVPAAANRRRRDEQGPADCSRRGKRGTPWVILAGNGAASSSVR